MRYMTATALILTTVFAAGASAASNPKKPAAASTSATHAVRGIVQSIDASTLVIKSSGHKGHTMSFAMDSATSRQGTVEVGSTVGVRYRSEGSSMVATAVAAEPAKAPKAAKTEHTAPKK